MDLSRRSVIVGLAASATLPRPSLAQGGGTLVRFVPQANLSALDPIWTSAYVVRNHGYMVFDTLYATDSAFRIRPQMAEGHETTDGGRSWSIRLRDGLSFHDGQKVLARDCVASLRRWAARDGFGQALFAQVDELSAPDDRTIRFRLKAPFPLLPEALGKLSSTVPFIMPERLAQTDPLKQVTEMVGSGPFRFLADQYDQGSRAAYAKFDAYVPRAEPPDGAAGGKVVHVSRVEWTVIPDAATAASALQSAEVDWVEIPSPDLLPLLAKRGGITVKPFDAVGAYAYMRFNHLQPPFDDVKVRQAVLHAVAQQDYMQAMVGDSVPFQECKAFFPCGTPLSTGEGGAAMDGRMAEAKALLKASTYDGRPVVVLSPTDNPYLAPLGEVTADLLKRLGMQVDLVTTDWGSVLTRRTSQAAPDKGGWNIFHTYANAVDFLNPATHLALRGNGRDGWIGWFTDAKLEALRTDWFAAPDAAAQRRIAAEVERECFAAVPYVPLGQFTQPTAYRSNIQGIVPAPSPFFWNLTKV